MRLFTVSMNEDDLKLVLKGLAELPYREVHKLVGEFQQVLLTPLTNPQDNLVKEPSKAASGS